MIQFSMSKQFVKKHFYFKLFSLVKQFQFKRVILRISIAFVYTQLNAKTVLFGTNQFSLRTVSMSKTNLFRAIYFSMVGSLNIKTFLFQAIPFSIST